MFQCIQDENCFAPECLCFSTSTPLEGKNSVKKTPQMVIISFDDAVTVTNSEFYQYISQFQNPNECPMSMTFFVSHEYNDYTLVNELHRKGHEIAVHTVTLVYLALIYSKL